MLGAIYHPHLERRTPPPVSLQSAVWTAGAMVVAIVALVVLFFGIFLSRAN